MIKYQGDTINKTIILSGKSYLEYDNIISVIYRKFENKFDNKVYYLMNADDNYSDYEFLIKDENDISKLIININSVITNSLDEGDYSIEIKLISGDNITTKVLPIFQLKKSAIK